MHKSVYQLAVVFFLCLFLSAVLTLLSSAIKRIWDPSKYKSSQQENDQEQQDQIQLRYVTNAIKPTPLNLTTYDLMPPEPDWLARQSQAYYQVSNAHLIDFMTDFEIIQKLSVDIGKIKQIWTASSLSPQAQAFAVFVTLYQTDYESEIENVPLKIITVVQQLAGQLFESQKFKQYSTALANQESAPSAPYNVNEKSQQLLDTKFVANVFMDQITEVREETRMKFATQSGDLRPEGLPGFPLVLLPVVIHTYQYRGTGGLVSPPSAYIYGQDPFQALLDAANEVLSPSRIQLYIQEVRNDHRKHPYLLISDFARWQACYSEPACAFNLQNTIKLDHRDALHVVILGDSGSCLPSVSQSCRYGQAYSLPHRLIEEERTQFVMLDYSQFDPAQFNNADSDNFGGVTLAHEVGHYLGLWHTHDPGEGCEEDSRGDFVEDTAKDALPVEQMFDAAILQRACRSAREKDFLQFRSCGGLANVRNVMAYTPPICGRQFTQRQVENMQAALYGFRRRLFDKGVAGAQGKIGESNTSSGSSSSSSSSSRSSSSNSKGGDGDSGSIGSSGGSGNLGGGVEATSRGRRILGLGSLQEVAYMVT